MANDPQQIPPLFSQFDVAANSAAENPQNAVQQQHTEVVGILQDILAAQDRQNQLLEELVTQMGAAQRQRASELGQWKQENPMLARNCRNAAETLSEAQTEYLRRLSIEINENTECLVDGDFMLNEFVDRYGPRLAHLNGVLQVLTQLGTGPKTTNDTDSDGAN